MQLEYVSSIILPPTHVVLPEITMHICTLLGMKVLPQARLTPIQRLSWLAALHNESCYRSTTFSDPESGATAAVLRSGASRAVVTFGRRAAAWFTRSTTDCSAFLTSSDIATFHIQSNGYDTET